MRSVCRVCGRRLTASAAAGIGPVCRRKSQPPASTVRRTAHPVDQAALEEAGQLALPAPEEP